MIKARTIRSLLRDIENVDTDSLFVMIVDAVKDEECIALSEFIFQNGVRIRRGKDGLEYCNSAYSTYRKASTMGLRYNLEKNEFTCLFCDMEGDVTTYESSELFRRFSIKMRDEGKVLFNQMGE